jgi:hypothetical protein
MASTFNSLYQQYTAPPDFKERLQETGQELSSYFSEYINKKHNGTRQSSHSSFQQKSPQFQHIKNYLYDKS